MLPFGCASRTCPGPYSQSRTGFGSWPEERGNTVCGACVCVCEYKCSLSMARLVLVQVLTARVAQDLVVGLRSEATQCGVCVCVSVCAGAPFIGVSCTRPYGRSCTGSGSWSKEQNSIVQSVCVCVCLPLRLHVLHSSSEIVAKLEDFWFRIRA